MLARRYGDLEDGADASTPVRVLASEEDGKHDDVERGDVRDEARRLRCGAETRVAANDHRYPARRIPIDPAPASTLYEEFHPFGTTSYAANDSGIEVSAKRYRYIGKERDEETGLYHLGARYYASWLGRWSAADPIGLGDGVNRYAYSRANPVSGRDTRGTRTENPGGPGDEWIETEAFVGWRSQWEGQFEAPYLLPSGEIVEGTRASTEPESTPEPSRATSSARRRPNASAAPFHAGLPPIEEAYASRRGTFSLAYDEAVEGFMDDSNPVWARAAFFGLSLLETPLALADKAGEALLNSPRNADLAGQFTGRAWLRENETLAIEDAGAAFSYGSAAFLGLGGPASLGLPSPRPASPTTNAAEGGGPRMLYHYTDAPEGSFKGGLWSHSSVTDDATLTAQEAVEQLGVKRPPDKIIPVRDQGHFVPNKPHIVEPHPLGPGGGKDFMNPRKVPPEDILPARPVRRN